MRKKIWSIVLVLFLFLIVYVIYDEFDRPHRRKQNFSLVKADVVNVVVDVMNGSQGADITYKIKINGRDIVTTTKINHEKSCLLFILINKQMDVVYEKDDPGNCEILLSRNSYKEYNLLPPKDILHVLEALETACGAIQ